MELVGRVQPLAEGGHAVFFPLPAEPARDEPIVLLQSAEEAGAILDVLNLKRALEMRMALAELPLVRPLTAYDDIIADLRAAEWEELLHDLQTWGEDEAEDEVQPQRQRQQEQRQQQQEQQQEQLGKGDATPPAAATAATAAEAEAGVQPSGNDHAQVAGGQQQGKQPPQQQQQQQQPTQQQQPAQATQLNQQQQPTSSGSGGSSCRRKRRRRSEAERLQPFSWDVAWRPLSCRRREEHPFNQCYIMPSSSRRPHKRSRAMPGGSAAGPAATHGNTVGTAGTADAKQHATADSACMPDTPAIAAGAAQNAGKLTPELAATDSAAAAAAAAAGMSTASGRPGLNGGDGAVAAAAAAAAAAIAAEPMLLPQEEEGARESMPVLKQEEEEEEEEAGDEHEHQQQQQQQLGLLPLPAQQQQHHQAEGAAGPPASLPAALLPQQLGALPPPMAALGFGLSWLAAVQEGQRRAAAARDAELHRLLAPVAALGGAAQRAAQRFAACFCTLLQPHQQEQHLLRLREEMAEGGARAARGWVDLTLIEVLKLSP